MTERLSIENKLIERNMWRLYLDKKGADVNFVFDADTDYPKKVPAHKIILSLCSPVFDTMFFGSMPEQADIPIVDTSLAAFEEFLQFFYHNFVYLTSKNIVHVTNLCKKYEMDESLKQCEIAFQKLLTIDDICWGYSFALLLERENLIQFCEERISRNPRQIAKSGSFLECNRNILKRILSLLSEDWDTMETVIACMDWSIAQCNYNNLEINPKNVRDQLGDIFCRIPFGKITTEQIGQYVASYKGIFTTQQFEVLIQMSLSNQPDPIDFQQNKYDGKHLECNRNVSFKLYLNFERVNSLISTTIFSSNKTLLLIGFNMFHAGFKKYDSYVEFKYNIYEGTKPTSTNKLIFEGHSKLRRIVLPGIVINTGKFYRVSVIYLKFNGFKHKINSLKNVVEMGHGIKITFSPGDVDKITELFFQIPQTTAV